MKRYMHAEQHLAFAKLVRSNAGNRGAAERERYIKKSNSFVVCVRLSAADRGGLKLGRIQLGISNAKLGYTRRAGRPACTAHRDVPAHRSGHLTYAGAARDGSGLHDCAIPHHLQSAATANQ